MNSGSYKFSHRDEDLNHLSMVLEQSIQGDKVVEEYRSPIKGIHPVKELNLSPVKPSISKFHQ